MNKKVPVIRKGEFKSYLKPGIATGAIFGVLGFFANMGGSSSLKSAILAGFVGFFFMLFIFIGIGFFSEEYFKRKQRLKKMHAKKYTFLHENNFSIHPDLYFEGIYRDYFFNVFPLTKISRKKKNINYVLIETFYSSNNPEEIITKEKQLSSSYFIGDLVFDNHCVEFIPREYEFPDFKECFDGVIRILSEENFNPISKEEWEKLYKK
ncbi:MAG: hypothetical protein Q4G63_05140 [Bacteroidia bacterium]|nr:hypothetical protein [Bacteroidia bacterium]